MSGGRRVEGVVVVVSVVNVVQVGSDKSTEIVNKKTFASLSFLEH